MKAMHVLDRIEYKPECHHCYSEEEVIKAMKKYARQKCKEQIQIYKDYIDKKQKGEVPIPEFD